MVDVVVVTLLFAGLILFFGSFAEFIFRRFGIPDVLFLIALGFAIGPSGLNYVTPEHLVTIAPVFTTFTLVFLLFDGAFNINLTSLIKEFTDSIALTLWNFFLSTLMITLIMKAFGFSWTISLLAGFALGGVSSSFVIPTLQQLNLSSKTYPLLTLESALTDVFSIVFSLAVIEFMLLGGIGIQQTLTQIVSLFAVGAAMGIIAGIIWFILVVKFFKEHNYMLTIAYLLVIFFLTEYFKGSGAIAALFFGLVLYNSRKISSIIRGITTTDAAKKELALSGDLGISITTRNEEFFYTQISFFLKTFFFVYIGILINVNNSKALIIGTILSVAIMLSRQGSRLLKKIVDPENKGIVNSMFARGLAAAAIAQIAIQKALPGAQDLAHIGYIVITGTIILASIKIFILRRKNPELRKDNANSTSIIDKKIERQKEIIKEKKQELEKEKKITVKSLKKNKTKRKTTNKKSKSSKKEKKSKK